MRQRLTPELGVDQLARWRISCELARRLLVMSARVPFGLYIISGWRSIEDQLRLARAGRPAADPDISTHTSCPATGADLETDIAVVPSVKAAFGRAAVEAGLRWGGGSPVDPETGIPSDWNHVDLGPRSR